MTTSEAARDPREPTAIEALLPWYAAGTLRRRDRQRVADAAVADPLLARQLELVREELAETIHLNETLGAPSPRVADRLMAAIDAEALAAARNLRDAGSLTVIALAERPLGGETTVIALDAALTSTGRQPILDLIRSGTLRPELLVGEDGAEAIRRARLAAVEAGSV